MFCYFFVEKKQNPLFIFNKFYQYGFFWQNRIFFNNFTSISTIYL